MKRLIVLASLLLSLTPGRAQTVYNFSDTIDLSSGFFFSTGFQTNFTLPEPTLNLQVGDTISGTISFEPGQSITLTSGPSDGDSNNAFFLGISFSGPESPYSYGPQYFAYYNRYVYPEVSSGSLQLQVNTLSPNYEGSGEHSVNFTGGDASLYFLPESSVTITGFSYALTLTSVNGPAADVPTAFDITYVNDTAAVTVPEPCTGPMLLCGLVFLGLATARQRLKTWQFLVPLRAGRA